MAMVKYHKKLNLLSLDTNCPIKSLWGHFVVLMGKNTMMKCFIRLHVENTRNKAFLNIILLFMDNVGLVFTKMI